MKLSVAHNFEPGFIEQLSTRPYVSEIFGKMDSDAVGGGRSTYTLRRIRKSSVRRAVADAHEKNISFNYLLNGASLGGMEQTRQGIRAIRRLLDFLSEAHVDAVTVASPHLTRIIRKQYPHFALRASAFAVVDSASKAKVWEDLGVDVICISAIACNRDFARLDSIRRAVSCDLQLIANAGCMLSCAWELTHMNLLTQSSRKGHPSGGFCLDYCFLNCSRQRLHQREHFIRATWIRPEDLSFYEDLGYSNFKILERSCPSDLLLKRVDAYSRRKFDGNLYELVAPVASIKKELGASGFQRFRMVRSMFRPHKIGVRSLLTIRDYARNAIPHDFSKDSGPIYIDNAALDGFLDKICKKDCVNTDCSICGYCASVAENTVHIDQVYLEKTRATADAITSAVDSGALWE